MIQIFGVNALILVLISVCSPCAYSKPTLDLKYEKKYEGAFKAQLRANGLKPNHEYVWTLNGRAGHSSNDVLIKECEFWQPTQEGYCDFGPIFTDTKGSLNLNIEEELPPGKYKIKFLIKDPDNWNVVLWNNFVRFKVVQAREIQPPISQSHCSGGKYSLFVNANPLNSRIRIMNIGPRYEPGICLKSGNYDIYVTHRGYMGNRQWVKVNSDLSLGVVLTPKGQSSNGKEAAITKPSPNALIETRGNFPVAGFIKNFDKDKAAGWHYWMSIEYPAENKHWLSSMSRSRTSTFKVEFLTADKTFLMKNSR